MRASSVAVIAALCIAIAGCATATYRECLADVCVERTTRAVGAHAVASIYVLPDSYAGDGKVRTEVNEPASTEIGWLERLAAALGRDQKPPRKITTTEAPAGATGQLVQQSHGSGVLEPLAETIKATGSAFGAFAGKVVVCVLTAGFRCQP